MKRMGWALMMLLAAGGAFVGAGWALPVQAAKKAANEEPTEEEKQWAKDWGYMQVYIREYQKAYDRAFVFPDQVAAMVRYAPETLKWTAASEARWNFKDRTFENNEDPIFRLKDLYRQARAHIGNFMSRLPELCKELPDRMGKVVSQADADTEKGAQSGSGADFDKGRKALEKVESFLALAEVMFPKDDATLAKLTQDVKGLRGRVEERQKAYFEKTKAKGKRPEERYAASDLEKVRSTVTDAWKAAYPADKILAVIVPSNTNSRVTLARLNETEKTLELEDVSLLPVRVVVAGEGGLEWVYSATLIKKGKTAAPEYLADVSARGKLTSPTEVLAGK